MFSLAPPVPTQHWRAPPPLPRPRLNDVGVAGHRPPGTTLCCPPTAETGAVTITATIREVEM